MKKLLASVLLVTLTCGIVYGQDLENQWNNRERAGNSSAKGMRYGKSEEFKNLTPEERHAKMQEVYANASPEQKARMDERRKAMQEKAKELGFDLNTAEGRQKMHEYRQQNRGQGRGKGKGRGQGQGQGNGQGRGRH